MTQPVVVTICMSEEMAAWLDAIVRSTRTSRSAVVRSMLQAIMDDDLREERAA